MTLVRGFAGFVAAIACMGADWWNKPGVLLGWDDPPRFEYEQQD